VINQTEALVAIDVNSGRSTRERNIEDTALRTNLEAAEEAARQLRMRDLAGLIVIDFIDMESRKNNASVERRLKDSLKNDRARIQVGSISHFGLMEMSRQRLRPSLAEASLVQCPHCAGMGHVRSSESAALHILRAIEDEGAKFRAAEIMVFLPPEVALYLFNHKRDRLTAIEARYAMRVLFSGDATLTAANFRIEKVRAQTAPLPAPVPSARTPITSETPQPEVIEADDEPDSDTDDEETAGAPAPGATETAEEGERRRRRRRRRGKRRPEGSADGSAEPAGTVDSAEPAMADEPTEIDLVIAAEIGEQESGAAEGAEEPARRRRSRGGRRRRPDAAETGAEAETPPQYAPPAPRPEPFYADIADIFEAAERAEAEALRVRAESRMVAPSAPEPEPEPEGAAPAPALEHVAAEALPEPVEPPVAAPAVRPVVISAEPPPEEKKRGWWRR
jgi:ribonuclease E